MPKMTNFMGDRKYVMDGYAFLNKQLEKMDDKLLEPLSATSWPRDMPVITGGGFVENIASVDVTYATSGGDEDSLIAEQANNIPVMQADFGKSTWKAMNWAHYMVVPYLQKEKLQSISMNIEETLNKGVRLYYDKTVDRSVYRGITKVGSTGLLNNANVTRTNADNGAKGTATWATKTADEILYDINEVINAVWVACDMSEDGLVNHILVPPAQFSALATRKVGDDGDKSILTFLLENNITKTQGHELVISPCKWCAGIGQGATDRMVAYINDE